MPVVGYSTNGNFQPVANDFSIPIDESVSGMLFDYSMFTNSNPFDGYPIIESYFKDGQVHLINNLQEAEDLGIYDNDFMQGVVYYHIQQFYNYVNGDKPLYIALLDSSNGWDMISTMHTQSGRSIFQIGIWTAKRFFQYTNNAVEFTNLVYEINSVVENISGKLGQQSSAPAQISVMLSANTYAIESPISLNLYKIPDGTLLNFNKISVCLLQNNTDRIKEMQSKLPDNASVGCIGLLMACVSMAYAEENIAYVEKFNLNKYDDFNNVVVPCFNKYFDISEFGYTPANVLTQIGYIVPFTYSGKEAGVYFAGDPTFSAGDYGSIARNRVMNKCRRITFMTLLPYLNGNYEIDPQTRTLSGSIQSQLLSSLHSNLHKCLINKLMQKQFTSINAYVLSDYDILEEEKIGISIKLRPINYNSIIEEKDYYQI